MARFKAGDPRTSIAGRAGGIASGVERSTLEPVRNAFRAWLAGNAEKAQQIIVKDGLGSKDAGTRLATAWKLLEYVAGAPPKGEVAPVALQQQALTIKVDYGSGPFSLGPNAPSSRGADADSESA